MVFNTKYKQYTTVYFFNILSIFLIASPQISHAQKVEWLCNTQSCHTPSSFKNSNTNGYFKCYSKDSSICLKDYVDQQKRLNLNSWTKGSNGTGSTVQPIPAEVNTRSIKAPAQGATAKSQNKPITQQPSVQNTNSDVQSKPSHPPTDPNKQKLLEENLKATASAADKASEIATEFAKKAESVKNETNATGQQKNEAKKQADESENNAK
ncbi:MAG TPA: hypothetical protein PLJ21_08145, partial [Pseudobdellovibrionaceae bacterium]|nr:hypothetical protein [Pseudobdellovibrionaceae bacterium]